MYACAEGLIRDGLAYVDSLTADEIREHRGTLTEPGRNSRYRDRSVDENLSLFRQMRAGEFPDGTHVLRARIDMASPNINMRDPTLYRIRHAVAPPDRRRLVASIRPTTTRTRSRTPSKGLRTRSARWSSRITVRCTTGWWSTSASTEAFRRARSRSSSRG